MASLLSRPLAGCGMQLKPSTRTVPKALPVLRSAGALGSRAMPKVVVGAATALLWVSQTAWARVLRAYVA